MASTMADSNSRSTRSTAIAVQQRPKKTYKEPQADRVATVQPGWTHLWTNNERIVLRLLNELFPWKPDERTTIFNTLFKDEHAAAGLSAGRDDGSLRAQWSDRTRPGRAYWENIKAGPQGRKEEREWQALETEVRRVAKEQGVQVTGSVGEETKKGEEKNKERATIGSEGAESSRKRKNEKLAQQAVGRSRKSGKFVKEAKGKPRGSEAEVQPDGEGGMEAARQLHEEDPEQRPEPEDEQSSRKRTNQILAQQAVGRSRKGGRFVSERKKGKQRAGEVEVQPDEEGTEIDGQQDEEHGERDDQQHDRPELGQPSRKPKNEMLAQQAIGRTRKGGRFVSEKRQGKQPVRDVAQR